MKLPADLPAPKDDGACSHLTGMTVPSLSLSTTAGASIDLRSLAGLVILFIYPRTAPPDEVVPDSWNLIPGARGCTPQACGFRDLSAQFSSNGVDHIFGMSTQDSDYQREVKDRLHLPFELLSDHELSFQSALTIPTFEWQGRKVMRRITLAISEGKIVKIWYPVFPPDKSADEVLRWLENGR